MITLLRTINGNSPLSETATAALSGARHLSTSKALPMTCGIAIITTGEVTAATADMAADNCDEISCPPDGALAESLKPAEGF